MVREQLLNWLCILLALALLTACGGGGSTGRATAILPTPLSPASSAATARISAWTLKPFQRCRNGLVKTAVIWKQDIPAKPTFFGNTGATHDTAAQPAVSAVNDYCNSITS